MGYFSVLTSRTPPTVKYVGLCTRFKSGLKKTISSGDYSPACRAGFNPRPVRVALWCNDWHCDMFLFEQFGFPLSVSFR